MIDFNALRQNYESLQELAYSPQGEGKQWFDQNDLARGRVILGIQYSPQDPDVEVLRFLLDQEILRAENDPFQGIGESLEVVSWLLALRKDPQDSLRFLRAKKANFDAHCGFDIQHVYSSGIRAMRDYQETLPVLENLRVELKNHIEDPLYDEDEIEEWLAWRTSYFGRDWEKETDQYRYDKLQELGYEKESLEYRNQREAAHLDGREDLQMDGREDLQIP